MIDFTKTLLALCLAMIVSAQSSAHHSAAAFNTDAENAVTGTVVSYSFRNPHVYMTLAVETEDGRAIEVEVEAGAASVISPLGFTRESVSVGDRVTIVGNPGRRKPDTLLLGRELYLEDGTYYPLNISSRSIYEASEETAGSIEGTWFSPRTSFFGFMGASSRWQMTDAGRQDSVASNPLATTQKDCIPIGSPALMFYPVANTISVESDRVIMTIDWLDTVRTVYLDGREHPSASQTFLHGHSTGYWEGDTLIVETTNFSDHPMGTSMAVPASPGKILKERFEVSEDGKQLIYSGQVSDPLYLVEPASWSGNWLYRPQMQHSNESCDLEAARKFLSD